MTRFLCVRVRAFLQMEKAVRAEVDEAVEFAKKDVEPPLYELYTDVEVRVCLCACACACVYVCVCARACRRKAAGDGSAR